MQGAVSKDIRPFVLTKKRMCDTMATKKGAGGESQEYDTSTGQYGGGMTFRQNTTYSDILKFFAKKSEAGWKNSEKRKREEERNKTVDIPDATREASGFSRLETKHHLRHVEEMGYKNKDEYKKAAFDFWKNGEGKIYYEIIPSSGDVRFHKYDEKTRRMISIDADGTVHTFMRPHTKAYFDNYKRSFNLREYTKD
jgi:hypothetical protein